MPPISKLLDLIRLYEEWILDLPGLVGVPVLMFTVGVPILFSIWLLMMWNEDVMAKHHCRATGNSHIIYVYPNRRGTSYEYSCDDGYRWR